MTRARATLLLAALLLASACASRVRYIPGTKAEDNSENRQIIGVIETYRQAMEAGDVAALIALAAPDYWQQAAAPYQPYGRKELATVLGEKLGRAHEIRYSLRYGKIRRQGDKAFVSVMVDASFTVDSARGPLRQDMRDENEFVLRWDGRRWLFLSGM